MASYFNKHNEGTDPSTTFVQADPSNFRSIVQKLTGPTTFKLPISNPPRHAKKVGHQISNHKLHERRKTGKKLEIILNRVARDGAMVMSSSPVSTLDGRESPGMEDEEEKAIAEKGYYLHPSPTRGADQPRLLVLFPLNSPK